MRLRFLIAVFALLAIDVTAKADPITVTVTDSAWVGLEAGQPAVYFPNVTVTFIGDTSNLVYNSTGYIGTIGRGTPVYGEPYYYIPGTATIQIGSLGTFTFDDPTDFFVNQNFGAQGVAIAGIALSPDGYVILATENAAFSLYTGATSIGPLSGPVSGGNVGFDISEGFITLLPGSYQYAYGAPSTLTATVDAAPTPEPSSLALLGTGILGLAATVRRRLR